MRINQQAPLAAPGIELWLVDLEVPAREHEAPAPGDWLDEAERARAARFHFGAKGVQADAVNGVFGFGIFTI